MIRLTWKRRPNGRAARYSYLPREHVLPGIIERVANLGPDIAPRLLDRFTPADFSWGLIRLIRVLEQLTRHYPGSCNAAVPQLIETIFDEQGDFTKEAATKALEAIGPPAVPLINGTLRRTEPADLFNLKVELPLVFDAVEGYKCSVQPHLL